jgi:hypothetical protein
VSPQTPSRDISGFVSRGCTVLVAVMLPMATSGDVVILVVVWCSVLMHVLGFFRQEKEASDLASL